MNFKSALVIFVCVFVAGYNTAAAQTVKDAIDMELNKLKAMMPPVAGPMGLNNLVQVNQTYCTCGVFLSGQFVKGSPQPPIGNPALLHEQESVMACNPFGSKQCTNKCLETVNS